MERRELYIPGTNKPDYKHEEIRKYREEVFAEIVSKGADGVSIDFCVYPPFLEPEKYGLLWRDWVREGIVDVLIPSVILPGRLFDIAIDEYVKETKNTPCRVFGCLRPKATNVDPDERKGDEERGVVRLNRPITIENDRAGAALLLRSGADGLQIGTAFSLKIRPTSWSMEEHPEWFLDMPEGYRVNNLSVPAIQEQKLKMLGEVMRKYAFDGLDIDFERHTPILPPGRQWELRESVTDFMRAVRGELLKISEEQGRVIMLSARVPDCLKGCHEDGLDIEQWIREDLVDCLTLGSRSFDIKVEEFRALSEDIQLYGCYDPHHTVDGYTFPTLETLRGVWYTHLQRGADGVEYFNWSGEGRPKLVEKYVKLYGLDPDRDYFARYAKDDFTGIHDRAFLEQQDKTYVIDRKGGYPWGIGYGNMNADRQLPCVIEEEGEVALYVAENAGAAQKATLKLLFEELERIPEITFNGQKLDFTAEPYRDLQVTTEEEAPVSGFKISQRLCQGIDLSKPCTMLTADVTGIETTPGYQRIHVAADRTVCKTIRLEKAELELVRNTRCE